jgi:hypothetical protein
MQGRASDTKLLCFLLVHMQPKEPKESDESGAFARLNAEEDAATDGDRRHLLQKTEPKEPKEVCVCRHMHAYTPCSMPCCVN